MSRATRRGRVLTCSPTRAARKGADRGDPNGEKDEDYAENKPDQGRFAQLGLQRISRSFLKPSMRFVKPSMRFVYAYCYLFGGRTACAGWTRGVLGGERDLVARERNEVTGFRTRLARRQAPSVLALVRRPVENFRAGPGMIATADNPRLKLPRLKIANVGRRLLKNTTLAEDSYVPSPTLPASLAPRIADTPYGWIKR